MKRSFQIDMPKVETFNRDFVVAQATEVFHDKGYNATSMQDLVDATGLNRSSIYNSFGCKLHLYLDCLKAYQYKYQKKNSNVLLDAKNAIEAIELLFNMYLEEMISDSNDRGCLITNCKSEMANHDDKITSFLNRDQKNTLDFLEDLVSRGQNQGDINTNKIASEYALYLFSSLQGFRMTGILVQDKDHLKGIIKTILQILI
ncbi:TetR/AcrR family transcriptional regulator [uncultured Psychroserpens sp.]|uniref:TetR/AcrR family transcriptional regulator n=1 Tax=uncultured Psychroserpens sp. TaxID=255436 RepID=UPI00260B7854|nr:TetR/AcrR family transcriptional regulator [uncultured Psychroserpens sp.]